MLTATSYRAATVLRLLSVVVYAFPIYYVAGALQPVMAESISGEGGEYLAFVVVGMVEYTILTAGVSSIPQVLGGSIRAGSFEALLATPTSVPVLLAGMTTYGPFPGRDSFRCAAPGGHRARYGPDPAERRLGAGCPPSIGSCLPFLAGALILVFRTSGRLIGAVIAASALLGGVYYPTRVIPGWLQNVSDFVPLTYGARALRRSLLDGASLDAIAGDVLVLALLATAGIIISAWLFQPALTHARLSGTLTLY
jgi:ABC-2 type transport system permease protein